MKDMTIILSIFLVCSICYRVYSDIEYDKKVEKLHQYSKMKLLGDAFVIHNRLGLAQKRQIHKDVILAHAKNLGYKIDTAKIKYYDDTGQKKYRIWTDKYRNETYKVSFDVYISSEGVVEKIRVSETHYLDLRLNTNVQRLIKFFCMSCDEKIPINLIYNSEYANTGPYPISFPKGREESIRFKLGLADAVSLHSKALFIHANSLGYTVLSTDAMLKTGNTLVKIETGESIFGRFVQQYFVETDRDGWVKSIVEKRSKSTQ